MRARAAFTICCGIPQWDRAKSVAAAPMSIVADRLPGRESVGADEIAVSEYLSPNIHIPSD